MTKLHVVETAEVITDEFDFKLIERTVDSSYWGDWLPDAEVLAEIDFAKAIDEAAGTDFAVFHYTLDLPESIATVDDMQIQDFFEEHAYPMDEHANILAMSSSAKGLYLDLLGRAEADKVKFWNHSDSRPEDVPALLPATEWMWQSGNVWVATVGETLESWFDEDVLAAMRPDQRKWLTRPIADLPATGMLSFSDADGAEKTKAPSSIDTLEDHVRRSRVNNTAPFKNIQVV